MKYLVLLLLLPMLVFGQTKEFIKEYRYTASNDDSRNQAKAKAMKEAQDKILHEVGVLVESNKNLTKTNDKQDFSEEIKTYTVGKVLTTVVAGTERFTDNEKGDMVYSATFKMVVDTVDLYRYLDNIVKQKEQARLAEIQQQQKIEQLKQTVKYNETQLMQAQNKESEELKKYNIAKIDFDNASEQLSIAKQDYNTASTASNASTSAGMSRVQNAMNYLQTTQNYYNNKSSDFSVIKNQYQNATNAVNQAQNNLYNSRVELAKASGSAIPDKPQTISTSNTPATKIINDIECVLVKAGTFMMGSPKKEKGRYDDETQHQVTITDDFYISKYEVTQMQYKKVMGTNPSYFKGDNLPVEQITWFNADDFSRKVGGRLPTEAEWEYAARGGNKEEGFIYSGSGNLDNVGWYWDNGSKTTHKVGTKSSNELGIYDMSGNVWEWCSDWYGNYSSGTQTNPTGSSSGSSRVVRGGCWFNYATYCRVAFRGYVTPSLSSYSLGFRVVFPSN